MSSNVPDEQPKSLVEKIGAALPIALTAIATAFAGLSTSELSYAMYWRSGAAQDQAKANDQWSFAGFKRDRALIAETTAATLRAVGGYRTAPSPGEPRPTQPPAIVDQVALWMRSDEKTAKDPPTDDEAIRKVLNAIHQRKPEPDILLLARKVEDRKLADAMTTAIRQAGEVESAWDAELDQTRKAARESVTAAGKAEGDARAKAAAEAATGQAAQYEVDARRYRAESTMNFWVGFLYEVRVMTSTAKSDRHRERSQNFFYAMLAAQIGATVSALGLARRQRSALWLIAGLAGVVSVSFGVYVYLGM